VNQRLRQFAPPFDDRALHDRAFADRGALMSDAAHVRVEFDARVQDPTILEEIDLYSELMIVAAASSEALTTEAIDRVLGLHESRVAG